MLCKSEALLLFFINKINMSNQVGIFADIFFIGKSNVILALFRNCEKELLYH